MLYIFLNHENGKETKMDMPFKTYQAAHSVMSRLITNVGVISGRIAFADGTAPKFL